MLKCAGRSTDPRETTTVIQTASIAVAVLPPLVWRVNSVLKIKTVVAACRKERVRSSGLQFKCN